MSYPEIIPGGSLPIAWQLRDKRVVLVGGGVVAAGRLVNLLNADALVTIIAPSSNLSPEIVYRIEQDLNRVQLNEQEKGLKTGSPLQRITHIDRLYDGIDDLRGADMVLTAIDDHLASLRIYADAKFLKLPINVADVPPNCDFYFGSLIRRGNLQVLVSTNGQGPKIANIIKHRLEEALPPNVDQAIAKVGQLRELLRERAPGVGGKLGQKRMKWMIGVCETWSLEQLAQLEYSDMRELLDKGWDDNGKVPPFEEIFSEVQSPVSLANSDSDPKPPMFSVGWGTLTTHTLSFTVGLLLGGAIMVVRQSKR